MCFGGRPKRTTQQRLDVNRLAQPSVLTAYQNALAHKLETVTPNDVDEHWSLIHKAIHSSCVASCGLTNRVVKPWISADSLNLLDTRRSIPAGSEHNETRLLVKRALKASLRKDREIWWTERAREMENAAASGNTRKLFHLIRATGKKRPGVSETICEMDGSLIHNRKRRLQRWAEHFQAQFNWPSATSYSHSNNICVPWSVPTEPPSEEEIHKEIQFLRRHKAPGSDDLPQPY